MEETYKRLLKRTFGTGDDSVVTNKKNAFRYPKDPESVFPKAPEPVYIDRRALALPREYLIKEKGMKNKNIKKQNKIENLNKAMKEAEDKVEGRVRENEVIDLNKMVNLDEYGNLDIDQELNMDNMTLDDGKNKKNKKKNRMEIVDEDINFTSKNKKAGNKKRKTRNSKSHYIVNY